MNILWDVTANISGLALQLIYTCCHSSTERGNNRSGIQKYSFLFSLFCKHPSIYSTASPGASHRDSSPDFPHLPASPVGHQVISKSAKRCNLFQRASVGRPPPRRTCPEYITYMVSRRQPDQMPKPPELAQLSTSKQMDELHTFSRV